MMNTQTLLASVVSGLLMLAPVAKADHTAEHKAEKAAKSAKGDHQSCECGDCKKNHCAKKKCEHCHHDDDAAAPAKEEKKQ